MCLLSLLVVSAGCLRYIRFDALPENDLRPGVNAYLRDLERAYELENRYVLRSLVYERFSGFRWGSDRLTDRMNDIFNQFSDIEINFREIQLKRSSRQLIVKFHWDLTWTCEDIDPARGCKDYDRDGNPDTINRQGRTIFYLVYIDGDWRLADEEGDLLLGAYEPGYRVKD